MFEVFDLIPAAIFVVDSGGMAKYANLRAATLSGYAKEEIAGNPVSRILGESGKAIEKILSTGLPDDKGYADLACTQKAGSRYWMRMTVSGPDENGCVILMGQDVTADRMEKLHMEERAESYRYILDMTPDSISISRFRDGKYLLVNNAFCQRTGYRFKEVIGTTSQDLNLWQHPEERERVNEILRRDGRVEGFEMTARYRNGDIVSVLLTCRVITYHNEECILSVSKNIEELKRAHRDIAEREETQRLILDSTLSSITITRISDGLYYEVNRAFCRLTGYSREEVIGSSPAELNFYKHPEDRKRLLTAVEKQGSVEQMELDFRARNGRILETLLSAAPITYHGEECLLSAFMSISELKAARRALQESEENARRIIESAPYSISVMRIADARYVHVNTVFCDRTGYTREEIIGRSSFELNLYANESDREKVRDTFLRDGGVDKLEVDFLAKDGTILESFISISPIFYGGEECVLSVVVEIGDLKAARRALKESEESYRRILEMAPNSITVSSISEGRYLQVNDNFCRRTGYSPEEVIGRTNGDLNLFADENERTRLLEAMGQDGRVNGLEIRFRAKDGSLLESLVSTTPFHFKGEVCILSMSIDITALNRAKRALEESETRFRTIFETAADAIFLNDAESGRFIHVNQAACLHLGYSSDEFLSMNISDVIDPQTSNPLKDLASTLRGDRPLFFESVHCRKDGTRIFVEVSSRRIVHKGRNTLLSIVRDVSKRKRVESELSKYREQLEEMVQDRTAELKAAQEELVKREKLSVLGQITATVSHELRNPLGVIRTSSFYLQRKVAEISAEMNDRVNKHFRRIEKQVALCDTIVDDLLEYTRNRNLSIKRASLTPWLKKLVEEMNETRSFPIVCEFEKKLPPVDHDEAKLRRVILNIIENAQQAVEAKENELSQSGLPYKPAIVLITKRSGNDVAIEVCDNGIGMDAKTLDRAIEPLFTTRARGTGIGLANVEKIVSEHGGTVSLESKPGEGTKAILLLRRCDARKNTSGR